jgi:hypothetical protein
LHHNLEHFEPEKPGCCKILKDKFAALLDTVFKSTLIVRFYSFLLIWGFVMVSFRDFDFYFTIEKLGISASQIALQYLWTGTFVMAVPLIYMKCFAKAEYSTLFLFVQCLYLYTYLGKLALANGWTEALGLPNFPVYFFTGSFVGPMEHGLAVLPASVLMAKLIPRGLESTMMSLTGSLISLS